jgi:hypothetical protein
MYTLDELSATPKTVEILGVNYLVGKLNFRDFGKLQSWLKDNVISPLRKIATEIADLPFEDRKYLLDQARKDMVNWPPTPYSVEGFQYFTESSDGQIFLLHTILTKHQKELTLDEVEKLYDRLIESETGKDVITKVCQVAFDNEADDEDPKLPKTKVKK